MSFSPYILLRPNSLPDLTSPEMLVNMLFTGEGSCNDSWGQQQQQQQQPQQAQLPLQSQPQSQFQLQPQPQICAPVEPQYHIQVQPASEVSQSQPQPQQQQQQQQQYQCRTWMQTAASLGGNYLSAPPSHLSVPVSPDSSSCSSLPSSPRSDDSFLSVPATPEDYSSSCPSSPLCDELEEALMFSEDASCVLFDARHRLPSLPLPQDEQWRQEQQLLQQQQPQQPQQQQQQQQSQQHLQQHLQQLQLHLQQQQFQQQLQQLHQHQLQQPHQQQQQQQSLSWQQFTDPSAVVRTFHAGVQPKACFSLSAPPAGAAPASGERSYVLSAEEGVVFHRVPSIEVHAEFVDPATGYPFRSVRLDGALFVKSTDLYKMTTDRALQHQIKNELDRRERNSTLSFKHRRTTSALTRAVMKKLCRSFANSTKCAQIKLVPMSVARRVASRFKVDSALEVLNHLQ